MLIIYDISIKPRFSEEELEKLLDDDYKDVLSTADVKCICEDFNSDYFSITAKYIMKEYYDIVNTISLHLPERMTVNHDVTGSSPVGGATTE